jgi:hypothetical protein
MRKRNMNATCHRHKIDAKHFQAFSVLLEIHRSLQKFEWLRAV